MKSVTVASRKWLVAALVALASATSATHAAVTIDASAVVAPSSDRGQFQTLEKTWTISASTSGGLHNLLVASPASIFIDYDPSIRTNSPGVVAKVIVTGDSEDLVNALNVAPWSKSGGDGDGIELRFRSDKREYRGHLLTTILVGDKQALRTVKTVMSGDVVVTDDVLAVSDASARLELTTFSSGDVRVFSTQKLTVRSLALSSFASGDIEFQAPSIDANDITVSDFASGNVAAVAEKITTGVLSTKAGASGDVYIQADSLVATSIETLVGGSGDVTLSRSGKCEKQAADVTGSGDYNAASIVCANAVIGVFASGDALVQVTDQLAATIMASGDIHYVNAAPKEVVVHGRYSHRSHNKGSKTVKQAPHFRVAKFTPSEIPQRTPELIEIRTSGGSWFFPDDDSDSDERSIIVVTGGGDSQWTSNLSAVVPSSVRESVATPVVLGVVGVAMVVAGVAAAARKFGRPQRNREEFSRLI